MWKVLFALQNLRFGLESINLVAVSFQNLFANFLWFLPRFSFLFSAPTPPENATWHGHKNCVYLPAFKSFKLHYMQPTASTHKCGPTGKWEKREIGGARAWKSEKFCRVVCTNSKCNCSSGGSARFTHIFVHIYLFSSAFYFISVYSRYGETFFFYFNTYTNIYIYIYSVCAFYFHFPNGENGKQKRIHTQEKRKKKEQNRSLFG